MPNPVSALDAQATVPYVTVASFRAWPSLLALGGLNSYSSAQTDQDAELLNQLLIASQWAIDECDQPLHAHLRVDQGQGSTRTDGRLAHHTDHSPVRQLTGFSFGYNGPVNQTVVSDLTNQWIEGDSQIVLPWGGTLSGSGLGSIQFGPPNPSVPFFATWTYVAGFANTVLTVTANAAATSIQVADPSGFYPGDVFRIYEPGKEEVCVVANNYVPGAPTILLASGLVFTHTVSGSTPAQLIGVSMMPASVREAVQRRVLASQLRPTTQAEDPWPGNAPNVSTRKKDPRGTGRGLLAEACRLLKNYNRVR